MLPTAKTQPKPDLADLTVLVYGQTKIGKSTFCSQSDGALFLATEPGLNALDVYQVPIQSWDDLLSACAEITEGKHPFRTIILDTIDNAYKFCTDYIVKKYKIEHESDLGYGQGYASSSISYHPASECGGNFSFVIDYGGKDSYGCGAQDSSLNNRGTQGGFLIDRPKQEEPRSREAAQPTRKGATAGS